MTACNHRYRKFNEALLFCTRCGTTKAIASYRTIYPQPYWIRPYPYWYGYQTWTDGGTSTTATIWNSTTGALNAEGRQITSTTSEPEGHEDD